MHQNQNIPKDAMDVQEPTVAFVSELQLIVDFIDDDEDFEKVHSTMMKILRKNLLPFLWR